MARHILLQDVFVEQRAGQRVQVDTDGIVFHLAVATELDAHHLQTGDLDRRRRLASGSIESEGAAGAARTTPLHLEAKAGLDKNAAQTQKNADQPDGPAARER